MKKLFLIVAIFILVSCGSNYVAEDGPNTWTYFTPSKGTRIWTTIKSEPTVFLITSGLNDRVALAQAEGWLTQNGCVIIKRDVSFFNNQERVLVERSVIRR